jgi:EAL domain-containing protein (putative c-di-GMP-specific phosphodiesterase class I)/PAS domain-containing protein/GGDEF domain-containing protein
LNPKLADNHMQLFWERIGLNGNEVVETINRCKDGRMIPVRVRSIAFAVGERKLIAAIARDISEERARAKALAESNQRFRELFTAIDKGVLLHDADANLIAINPAAQRIFDMPDDWRNLDSKHAHFTLLDEEFNELAIEQNPFQQAISGKACESRTFGVFHPHTQRYSWISASITPLTRDNELAPYLVMTIFSDVTELKRASEFLEQAQQLAGLGCWEYDVGSRSVHWSDALFAMLGLPSKGEISIEDAFASLHPVDAQLMRRWWRHQLEVLGDIERDVRVRTGADQWLWLRIRGKPHLINARTAASEQAVKKLWRYRGTAQDITQEKLAQDRLARMAQTDSETGLMNRAQALAVLENKVSILSEIGNQHSHQHELFPGLLLVDLDRLKLLREIIGETASIELMKRAIERLRSVMPSTVEISRFSDVELLLMMDTRGDRELWSLADAITKAFVTPFAHQDEEFLLTPAMGLARFPDDGKSSALLLRHLDAATSEAKQRAGSSWQGFSAGLAMKMRQRLQLEAQLRNALQHGEFTLLYQPKVNLRSGKLEGVEALIRWHNRLLGELSPNIFIPYAEATGDIVQIGNWVLSEACKQMREWMNLGVEIPHVSINVSFRQFVSERFVPELRELLERYQLPGNRLEVELTERVLVEDSLETEQTIAELRRLGVGIVIDDFGEGYSALGYLRRFRVDGLKISHQFMKEIPHSDIDSKVCQAIIAMAGSLKLGVVAEGVETPAQCDFLLAHHCEVAQGFMFSAPIEASAMASFIESFSR